VTGFWCALAVIGGLGLLGGLLADRTELGAGLAHLVQGRPVRGRTPRPTETTPGETR
jgi:hypothetical protein